MAARLLCICVAVLNSVAEDPIDLSRNDNTASGCNTFYQVQKKIK